MPHATPRFELPEASDPSEARIAMLSAEYMTASPERREEIGQEIEAMITGQVTVLPFKQPR